MATSCRWPRSFFRSGLFRFNRCSQGFGIDFASAYTLHCLFNREWKVLVFVHIQHPFRTVLSKRMRFIIHYSGNGVLLTTLFYKNQRGVNNRIQAIQILVLD